MKLMDRKIVEDKLLTESYFFLSSAPHLRERFNYIWREKNIEINAQAASF